MDTAHTQNIFDFSYITQVAKEQFGIFVRCLYKIAEINANLAEAQEIYEETKQTIYCATATNNHTLNDCDMYALGINQSDYFQQKIEYQTQKAEYEKQLFAVYDYFFGNHTFASLSQSTEAEYQVFEQEFIAFLAYIEAIDPQYHTDTKLLRKNVEYRSLYYKFRRKTQPSFLGKSAFIQNNELQIYQLPNKETFYQIVLWMFYEILERKKIVIYDYEEDNIIISDPKYRIKEHDFTNEEFFKQHFVNVYGNLKNSVIHCDHSVISVKAFVQDVFYENKKYHISLDYCTSCKQYFVDSETIDSLRVSYHQHPKLRYNPEKGDMYHKNPRSTLSLYGYSVRKDLDLSPKQRRNILDAVIKNQVLTKLEVIDLIEMNITMREYQNNNHEAISKWRSDLQYIRNNLC